MEETDVLYLLTPHSSEGFYARNNQFQWRGTKGFTEFRILKTNDLYLRIDLPGVSKEHFSYSLSEDKKSISFQGEAPKESPNEENGRSYAFSFSLSCNCCEVADIKPDVRDGVVRMVLQKVQTNNNLEGKPCSNEFGDQIAGGSCGPAIDKHPYVTKGSKEAYEAKPTSDGGLFLRVDMPGVAKEDAMVIGVGGDIRFFGKAKRVAELHDDEGYEREYMGSVSTLPPMVIMEGQVHAEFKDGILKMVVPPA